MIKAIFWDFDGTIADTTTLTIKAINTLAKEYNREHIPRETFRAQSIKNLIKNMHIHRRQVILFVRKIKRYIQSNYTNIHSFPGIEEVFHTLSKQYIQGIVTSNKSSTVQKHLDKEGFSKNIEIIHCGLWNKAKKIKKLMKRHKLQNNEVVYIGDEVRDIEACKQIGIKIIAVSWGYNNQEILKENTPNMIISHPKDIIDSIKKIENQKS